MNVYEQILLSYLHVNYLVTNLENDDAHFYKGLNIHSFEDN